MWRCDNVGGLDEHVTCHMFWFLITFSPLYLGLPYAPTGRPILVIYTSYDAFPRTDVPSGVLFWFRHLGDQIFKKTILGTWSGFYMPNVQNIETCILSKLLHRFQPTNFCTTLKTTKCSSWVVRIRAQQIQAGGRPPFWKSPNWRYLGNGCADLHHIWHVVAEPVSSSNHQALNLRILKLKMADVGYSDANRPSGT